MPVREVKWSDSGELVAILSDQSFYVLRFARDGASTALIEMGPHLPPFEHALRP